DTARRQGPRETPTSPIGANHPRATRERWSTTTHSCSPPRADDRSARHTCGCRAETSERGCRLGSLPGRPSSCLCSRQPCTAPPARRPALRRARSREGARVNSRAPIARRGAYLSRRVRSATSCASPRCEPAPQHRHSHGVLARQTTSVLSRLPDSSKRLFGRARIEGLDVDLHRTGSHTAAHGWSLSDEASARVAGDFGNIQNPLIERLEEVHAELPHARRPGDELAIGNTDEDAVAGRCARAANLSAVGKANDARKQIEAKAGDSR